MPHIRFGIALLLIFATATYVCGCDEQKARPAADVAGVLGESVDESGYAHADRVREFGFPTDHGPHPQFRSEWWYFTGNLQEMGGRRFGYQLTFFRFALSPHEPDTDGSAWRTNQLYLAHFTLSDIDSGRFHAFERASRAAIGVAGASAEPFSVWIDDWSVFSDGGADFAARLRAAAEGIAIDLTLSSSKPLVLQGDRGLSQKGKRPGNASYYYSFTRMPTSGTVTIDGEVLRVEGTSWMDREWSTSALERAQQGWDWFSLQFDDDRELMYYRLRRHDGRPDPHSAGVLVERDGATKTLRADAVQIEELGAWRSPRTGVRYPARWRLRVPSASIELTIEPLLAAQELDLTMRYWEGAVRFTGTAHGKPVAGVGYTELVGYTTTR